MTMNTIARYNFNCSRRSPLNASVILLAMCMLVACQPKEAAHVEPESHEEHKAVTLPLERVKKEHVRKTLEIPGHVTALPDHSVQVTPHITGKIEHLVVVPGQYVKKGQLIAILDDDQIQAQLRQAITPIQSAKAAIKQADIEHEFAKRELVRLGELYSKDLAAKKDVLLQETNVETTKSKLAAAKSRLEEIRSATGDEETLLNFTKILSPISGVVAERFLNIGDEARPNAPIVHVVDLSQVIVDADMPADVPNKVSIGQKATVRSVAEPDQPYPATIISMSPIVDTQKNTIKIRLQCVNKREGLREGQSVTVSINTGVMTTSILVPRSAIIPDPEDPKATLIYVIKQGKSKRVPVVTGDETSETVEIKEGLSEGDTIIVSGGYGLPEGIEVKPAEAKPSEAKPSDE